MDSKRACVAKSIEHVATSTVAGHPLPIEALIHIKAALLSAQQINIKLQAKFSHCHLFGRRHTRQQARCIAQPFLTADRHLAALDYTATISQL